MFFGDKKKKKLTQAEFDKQVESLVQTIKASVSPFLNDTAEQQRARVARAQYDQDFFNQTYLPHYFTEAGADFHREMEEMIAAGEAQQRPVAIAAPRGHAKSTRISFAHALKKALYKEKKFIILCSDTEQQASGFTVSVRSELEFNPRLVHDFGKQKTKAWAADEFDLRSGTKFLARGRGQSVRGLKNGPHRPDLIVLDDIENDESVRNPDITRRVYDWIMRALVPSLEPRTGVLFIVGSLLSLRSVLAQCIANKEFIAKIFRAIEQPTWGEDAQEFTAGIVLWPQRFSLRKLSSIRRLVGSIAFNQEYQNNPQDDQSKFKTEWIQRFDPRALPREVVLRPYGGIDPSLKDKKTSDYKANVTVAAGGGKFYCLHAWIKRTSLNAMIEQAYLSYARFHQIQIGLETVGWQELLRTHFDTEAEKRHLYLPIVPIERHGISKDDDARVGGLSPLVENGVLLFAQGPESDVGDLELLIEQLIYFGTPSVHDDGPDALETATNLGRKRTTGKPSYEGFHDDSRVQFAREGTW